MSGGSRTPAARASSTHQGADRTALDVLRPRIHNLNTAMNHLRGWSSLADELATPLKAVMLSAALQDVTCAVQHAVPEASTAAPTSGTGTGTSMWPHATCWPHAGARQASAQAEATSGSGNPCQSKEMDVTAAARKIQKAAASCRPSPGSADRILSMAERLHDCIAHRVQKASARHNERRCDAMSLLSVGDIRRAVFCYLSIGVIWSCRSICKEFREFVSSELSSLPQLAVSGGFGGCCGNVVQSSVALLDLSTMRWSAGRPMAERRFGHASCVLADGRLLVAGGASVFRPWGLRTGFLAHTRPDPLAWPYCMCGPALGSTEIYDPQTGRWTTQAPLAGGGRIGARAVGLPDGRALLVGGVSRRPDAAMSEEFMMPLGADQTDQRSEQASLRFLATSEIFCPASGLWTPAPYMMSNRRADFGITLLPAASGEAPAIVVAGGIGFAGNGQGAVPAAVAGSSPGPRSAPDPWSAQHIEAVEVLELVADLAVLRWKTMPLYGAKISREGCCLLPAPAPHPRRDSCTGDPARPPCPRPPCPRPPCLLVLGGIGPTELQPQPNGHANGHANGGHANGGQDHHGQHGQHGNHHGNLAPEHQRWLAPQSQLPRRALRLQPERTAASGTATSRIASGSHGQTTVSSDDCLPVLGLPTRGCVGHGASRVGGCAIVVVGGAADANTELQEGSSEQGSATLLFDTRHVRRPKGGVGGHGMPSDMGPSGSPSSSCWCRLPSLPMDRAAHTLNALPV